MEKEKEKEEKEEEEVPIVHEKLLVLLASHPFRLVEHKAATTSKDAADIRGSRLEQGAKALVLRSKGEFLLFVTSAATNVDMKSLKAVLKLKTLSFATEAEVWELARLRKGAVPPFGSQLGIKTYCDESLQGQDEIVFNAGLRTKSIFIPFALYLRLEAPTMVNCSTLEK